jgi:hypothetical protein
MIKDGIRIYLNLLRTGHSIGLHSTEYDINICQSRFSKLFLLLSFITQDENQNSVVFIWSPQCAFCTTRFHIYLADSKASHPVGSLLNL